MRRIGKIAIRCSAMLLIPGLWGCGVATEPPPASPTPRAQVPRGTPWPGWGGPSGDFSVSGADLADAWPAEGPPALWARPLGQGYSALVFDGETLYTMYREREDEIAIAIDARTGETRWEHRYRAPARVGNVTQFGRGPNATPLLLDDRLITLGYSGDLRCLDLDTGEVVWSHSLLDGLGGEVLEFGYSASPIVHDGHVVVLVGGDRYGAAAFDPADGSLVWSTPPSSVSYATPLVIQLEDQSQLVYFTADEIVGAEAGVGTRLWSYPVVNQYRNNATGPLWGNDGLLWVATQLDGGTRVLRVDRIDGATRVEEVWSSDPARCQGTPGAGRVVSGGPSDSLTNPDSRRPDLDGPDTGRLDSLRPRPGVRARLRPR